MVDQQKCSDFIYSKLKNVNVTCLKLIDGFLLAGIAGDLYVFKLAQDEFNHTKDVDKLEIFPSQNIYGIAINKLKILIFGGKKVSVLTSTSYCSNISITSSWTSEDWILDGIWIENNQIALLTAHNVLLCYSCSPVNLLTKAYCIERCILYSGKIIGFKWEELVVLAGTVYQELVVWAPLSTDKNAEIPVLHRLKGHKGVIFSISYDSVSQSIASTSDDRTVRVWSVKLPESGDVTSKWENAVISLSFTAFGHTARVWKAVFTSSGYLVTVGEDSQIYLWNKNGAVLNRWEHNGEIRCLDYCDDYIAVGGFGIILRSISSPPEVSALSFSSEYGSPRCVFLSRFGFPITATDKGFLVLKNDEVFESVYDERFILYCVMSKSLYNNYILQGSIKGDLVLLEVSKNNISKVLDYNFYQERIYSLTWADSKTIVSCQDNGRLLLLEIKNLNGSLLLEKNKEFTLPSSKERWITCALLIEDYLICGDRMGSLHLYSLKSHAMDPLNTLAKLHGMKGVSDVKRINNIVYSTGRDGTLRELSIVDNMLHLDSTLKLPMDWATCLIESKMFGMVIAGFHGTNFLLWSAKERITILDLECGGGHRSFDCFFDEEHGDLILAYIRMKDVKYMKYPLKKLVHQTVFVGYHTKSINAACLLSMEDKRVIALTGSEDNSLKLCGFERTKWKGCSTYIRHISAVRTVKCVEKVIVSAGARAQLIVWNLHKNASGELCLKEVMSHMIRNEKDHHRSWKNAEPLVDPETRYMDLEIVKVHENIFMIFAACSDGMLRILEYDQKCLNLSLKKSVESEQGCLLKISAFKWSNDLIIVTGGTKGNVAFWHSPFDSAPSRKHPVHSMGINAMDHVLLQNHLVLGTGGDDSSIVLSAFDLNKNKAESLVFNIVEHVHTCQVSGLKMTREYLISAALDQKLCLFQWAFDGNYLKTTFICYFLSSVPDIHGILSWTTNNRDLEILLYGCGFELIHFNGSNVPS